MLQIWAVALYTLSSIERESKGRGRAGEEMIYTSKHVLVLV